MIFYPLSPCPYHHHPGDCQNLVSISEAQQWIRYLYKSQIERNFYVSKRKKNPVLYRLQICFSNGSHISVPKSKDVIYQGTLSVDICIPLFASSQGFYVHMVEGEIRGSVGPLSWSSVFTGVLASLLHAEARASGDTYKATVLVTVSGYLS